MLLCCQKEPNLKNLRNYKLYTGRIKENLFSCTPMYNFGTKLPNCPYSSASAHECATVNSLDEKLMLQQLFEQLKQTDELRGLRII